MLVMNYQTMLHYIPEEQRSHLNCGGNLKIWLLKLMHKTLSRYYKLSEISCLYIPENAVYHLLRLRAEM